jgi:hypothetical protein
VQKELADRAIEVLARSMSEGISPRTPATIRVFMGHARTFLDRVGDTTPGEQEVMDWIAYCRRTRKAVSYQNLGFFAVKALYLANGWPWPSSLSRGPRSPQPYELQARGMPVEEIKRLISWAKRSGSPQDRFYLALSTTYGLRREEMKRMNPEDIRPGPPLDLLLIKTGKHGRARWHEIPGEIKPLIAVYTPSPVSLSTLSNLLVRMCHLAKVDCYGWHGIRRTLANVLEPELGEINLTSFMRWSTSGRMGARYTLSSRSEREVDQKAFGANIFLREWAA